MRAFGRSGSTVLVGALILAPALPGLASSPRSQYVKAPFEIHLTVTMNPITSRVGDKVDFVFTATCDHRIPDAWIQVTLEVGRNVFDHLSLDSARKLKEMRPDEPVVIRKRVEATDWGLFSLRLYYYYPAGPGKVAIGTEIVSSGCVLPALECSVPNAVPQPAKTVASEEKGPFISGPVMETRLYANIDPWGNVFEVSPPARRQATVFRNH